MSEMSAGNTIIMAVAVLAALVALEVVFYTMNHFASKDSGHSGQAARSRVSGGKDETGLEQPRHSRGK